MHPPNDELAGNRSRVIVQCDTKSSLPLFNVVSICWNSDLTHSSDFSKFFCDLFRTNLSHLDETTYLLQENTKQNSEKPSLLLR